MLESLITLKKRLELLVNLFINARTPSYLQSLEKVSNESSNSIRPELNRNEGSGLLSTEVKGNRKYFRANAEHPFFEYIHHLLLKHMGIETLLDEVVNNIGNLKAAYATGDFAKGIQSKLIDLIFIGKIFDYNYINMLISKVEEQVSFKIRYMTITEQEKESNIPGRTCFVDMDG